MQPHLEFDEIHVVSDLHLGGFDDTKIFGMDAELAKLIEYAKQRAATKRVAFIINGDFVDFLAARDADYFDAANACEKLDDIVKEFAQVFDALRELVKTPGAHLVVNIGNHDLELALPWVKEHLLRRLCDADAAARGRILLEMGGAGVLMQVANARVLCVHGNEVDDWNVVDYEALRRIGQSMQQGVPVKRWIPNGGTRLVIEVMNEIKRNKYPFVDLLKPETGGVLRALIVLEPSLAGQAFSAIPAFGRKVRDGILRWAGFLSDDEASTLLDAFPPADPLPQRRRAQLETERRRAARELLATTEHRFSAGYVPMDLVRGSVGAERLDMATAIVMRFRRGYESKALREALQPLIKDRSFNPFEPDDTYRDLDEKISGDVDILIAGHTHLERCLPRRSGRGIYYNTGTWARLVRLSEDVLKDEKKFEPYFAAFGAGSIKALDAAGIVEKRPTFVSVWSDGTTACADLRHVKLNGTPNPYEPATGDTRALYTKT